MEELPWKIRKFANKGVSVIRKSAEGENYLKKIRSFVSKDVGVDKKGLDEGIS